MLSRRCHASSKNRSRRADDEATSIVSQTNDIVGTSYKIVNQLFVKQ
jgi:hypothetical protein